MTSVALRPWLFPLGMGLLGASIAWVGWSVGAHLYMDHALVDVVRANIQQQQMQAGQRGQSQTPQVQTP